MLKRFALVLTCCITIMAFAQSDIRSSLGNERNQTSHEKSRNPASYEKDEGIVEDEESQQTNGTHDNNEPTSGVELYNTTCKTCHEIGLVGAPKTGDKRDWKKRIQQGKTVLYRHAIEGYEGKTGMMPPKGGNPSVSDELIKQAVDYMIKQSK